ncbi:hypothetical protein ABMC89_07940 [Sulfitobacter sp. HNIBRBA3233]|uniref:hypothetical protein n=1 Tax=Sulfitobacter marinivivus TaxID=3158558 RepID=UPI0032DF6581
MRLVLSLFLAGAVAACAAAPVPPAATSLPLFGDGYRFEGDACRRVGEAPQTVEYLDDAADLVACPEDLENLGVFVIDFDAVEVALVDGYRLFSVPVR